ncbi:MAG: hypothetical protein IIU43_10210, partial [Thermoguttaceae bacterium]|nr:hypothetical protein [Thermoguttaceae bacterium]
MNHSAKFIFSVSFALVAALASGTAFGDEPNQKLDPARLAVSASDSDAPQTVRTTDGRELKLVWNDEFNGEGLPDAKKWTYEVGYIRNNESQYYTDARLENVFQKDGVLTI